jgi:diguanylate cyclase (GGDEF)-like protein
LQRGDAKEAARAALPRAPKCRCVVVNFELNLMSYPEAMLGNFVRSYLDAGEIDTASGRAIVEERYFALRQQIPIIYVLAVVNLCGLQLATGNKLEFGVNVPTLLGICAFVRVLQWLRTPKEVTHAVMLRRMRQTCCLATMICLIVCVWCLHIQTVSQTAAMAVMLFGGLTAIGVSYGLGALPAAARLPLLVLALPLAAQAGMSSDPQFVGAALSLAVVALLILRLLNVHNAQFTDVIRSRSMIAREQELAEHARQEATLAATTDFLTGLPNRRAFVAALDAEIAPTRPRRPFAVAVVDLDRFKAVNDTFGHASGDKLLQTVAERLLHAAGKTAVVARLGGDEFGLLFPKVACAEDAMSAGVRLLSEVNRPAVINGRQFAVSACCGLGMSRKGKSRTPSRILADADLALYEAKDRPGGGVAVFEPRMEAPQRRRSQVERALQLPDVHDRIHLVFQPIIDLHSGRLVANEALARWRDPELGDVSPSEFVPLAEQLNVIGSISDRLMMKAFIEALNWPASVRLSFNLSAVQLCEPGSAESILRALQEVRLPTGRLQVEVTETALLADFTRARENLGRLSTAGVTIVLDDFGAGYASIGYLRELRFDQIKLDGALVTAAQDSPDGERLLAAVIGLCQALGVSTIAEHVENDRQLTLLIKLGCSAGQGFWLQPPLSAEACRELSTAASLVFQGDSLRRRLSAA